MCAVRLFASRDAWTRCIASIDHYTADVWQGGAGSSRVSTGGIQEIYFKRPPLERTRRRCVCHGACVDIPSYTDERWIERFLDHGSRLYVLPSTTGARRLIPFAGQLVGTHATGRYSLSRFRTFEKELYLQKLTELVPLDRPIPHFDEDAIRGFLGSLEKLGPMCRSIEELQYLAIMRSIATSSLYSPLSGTYLALHNSGILST